MLTLACVPWLASCTDAPAACEVQVARQPLTNGTSHAEYLKLEPWHEAAVVEILVAGEPQCSGLLVARRTVLTAAHCVTASSGDTDAGSPLLEVRFASADEPASLVPASVLAAHPQRDVLLLELEHVPDGSLAVQPIAVARALPQGLAQDSLVQLAGFGGDGSSRGREFIVERVQAVHEDEIVVSAAGLAGACSGDSGGPLLVRGDDGHPRTIGALSSGAAGCFGRDTYERLDTLSEWLAMVSEQPIFEPQEPDGVVYRELGAVGRCFDGRAIWIEQGRVRTDDCSRHGCGWSAEAEGYRCVRSSGACAGISDVGRCDEEAAVRCVRGRVEHNPCGSCGFSCAHSPRTGAAICTSSRAPDGG